VWAQNDEQYEDDHAVGQRLLGRFKIALGHAATAFLDGRVVFAPHNQERCPKRENGEHNKDAGNHISHGITDPDTRNSQECLRGEHVVYVQQQRCAQVVKNLDEHQRSAGDISWHCQRENDALKEPQSITAETLGCFLH